MEGDDDQKVDLTFGNFKLHTENDLRECVFLQSRFDTYLKSFRSSSPEAIAVQNQLYSFLVETESRVAAELTHLLIVACGVLRIVPGLITGDPNQKELVSESMKVASRMGGKGFPLPLVCTLKWELTEHSIPELRHVDAFQIGIQTLDAFKSKKQLIDTPMYYQKTFRNNRSGRREFVDSMVMLNDVELSHPAILKVLARHHNYGQDAYLKLYRESGNSQKWTDHANTIAKDFKFEETSFQTKLHPIISDMKSELRSPPIEVMYTRARMQMPTLQHMSVEEVANGKIKVTVIREWWSSFLDRRESDNLTVVHSFVNWPDCSFSGDDVRLYVARGNNVLVRPMMVNQLLGFGNISKFRQDNSAMLGHVLLQASLQMALSLPTPVNPLGFIPWCPRSEVILFVDPTTELRKKWDSDYLHCFPGDSRGSGPNREFELYDSKLMTKYMPIPPANAEEERSGLRFLGWHALSSKNLIYMFDNDRVLNEFGRGKHLEIEAALEAALEATMLEATMDDEKSSELVSPRLLSGPNSQTPPTGPRKAAQAILSLPASISNLAYNKDERTGSVPRGVELISPPQTASKRQKVEATDAEATNTLAHATHTPQGNPVDLTVPNPAKQSIKNAVDNRLRGEPRHKRQQESAIGRREIINKAKKQFKDFMSGTRGGCKHRKRQAQMRFLFLIAKTGFDDQSIWGKRTQAGRHEFKHALIDTALQAKFPNQHILTQTERRNKLKWKSKGKTLKALLEEWYVSE